jgi:hypothetical protein
VMCEKLKAPLPAIIFSFSFLEKKECVRERQKVVTVAWYYSVESYCSIFLVVKKGMYRRRGRENLSKSS